MPWLHCWENSGGSLSMDVSDVNEGLICRSKFSLNLRHGVLLVLIFALVWAKKIVLATKKILNREINDNSLIIKPVWFSFLVNNKFQSVPCWKQFYDQD